jgi:hypothetical protein
MLVQAGHVHAAHQGRLHVLPGAEDADEGGIRDADVVTVSRRSG